MGIPRAALGLPLCFLSSGMFQMQHCPAYSPSSALLCAPHASLWLQVLNLGLQRTYIPTPPSREMLRHAWSLGLLPLQLVPVPGSPGNTRAWVLSILTEGFPGNSTPLNSTRRWGSFFPKTGTSLRVKSCRQAHLCVWSCCGKTGRMLQHVPTAKGWWRKRLEERRRVITWRSTRDPKASSSSRWQSPNALIRCWEQRYKTLLLPFLENALISYTAVGQWGLPLCCCCCLGHPISPHSPPQQIHPSPKGEIEENTLINPNRGSPIFPPKAFLPHLLRAELEGCERVG